MEKGGGVTDRRIWFGGSKEWICSVVGKSGPVDGKRGVDRRRKWEKGVIRYKVYHT